MVWMRPADVRSIVERLEGAAVQAYADGGMLGVFHTASWSRWGIWSKVGGDTPRMERSLPEALALSRCGVVQHMKAEPAECADHGRY
jgi:hypothetical protein